MPSKSNAQRVAAAIAEHSPDKLYKRNRGLLKMTKGQLHEFASSVKGSGTFTPEEMNRGYRKVGE